MTEIRTDRFLDLVEARKRLGNCSRQSLYNWSRAGDLELVKLGGRTVIRESELVRFMESRPAKPVPAA